MRIRGGTKGPGAESDFSATEFTRRPPLPAAGLTVDPGSDEVMRHALAGNALCGVVNLRTGVIYLYPLLEEPKQGEDDTDSYGNTRYNPDLREHRSIRNPEDHSFRMVPIKHFDARYGGAVSHEQLVTRLGGNRAEFIGFTVWIGDGVDHELVATSRSLNSVAFGHASSTNGRMTMTWAQAVAAALGGTPSLGRRS